MGKASASFLCGMLLVALCDLPAVAQRGGHGGGARVGGGGGFRGGGSAGASHFGGGVRVGGGPVGRVGGFVGFGGGVHFGPRFPHRGFGPRVVIFGAPFGYGYPFYPYYPGYSLYPSYVYPPTPFSYDSAPVYDNPAPQPPTIIMMQSGGTAPPAAAPAPAASPLTLLAFKNHNIYLVSDYSVENGRLTYTTDYGATNTVDLDQLDLELSRRLNRERHVPFPINDR